MPHNFHAFQPQVPDSRNEQLRITLIIALLGKYKSLIKNSAKSEVRISSILSLSDLADGTNCHGRGSDDRGGVGAADRPDVRDGKREALKRRNKPNDNIIHNKHD